jgi:chitin disaccharide deacetylase
MIIINADDFGRTAAETDVTLRCYRAGRITSTTAMVYMTDSRQAAELALETGIDVGLHVNLSQLFEADNVPSGLRDRHARVVKFFTRNKYSVLLYNPVLRDDCRHVYQAQVDEFVRLYGRQPSHVDGHQHKHLCTNMLVDRVIPARSRVRRSFSFFPGEKAVINRAYRGLVDHVLARRYRTTDFFFSLPQCLATDGLSRVFELATRSAVELMTHPLKSTEYKYLMSDAYLDGLQRVTAASYSAL